MNDVFFKIVSVNRKQRPTSVPVQRIVLNSALETTVEAAVESPRATISEKIRVRMTYIMYKSINIYRRMSYDWSYRYGTNLGMLARNSNGEKTVVAKKKSVNFISKRKGSGSDKHSLIHVMFTTVSFCLVGRTYLLYLLTSTFVAVFRIHDILVPYGSGSVDLYHWLTDQDPDPAALVINIQEANKIFFFLCLLLFEGTFTSFFKDKKS